MGTIWAPSYDIQLCHDDPHVDVEGIHNVDINASSHHKWKRWTSSLSSSKRTLLAIFRAGAVWTPTRRYSFRDPSKTVCKWCKHPRASMRHFWADCPHFAYERFSLEREYIIDPAWWGQQPRCLAKSGWITFGAHVDHLQRAILQVASCRLALFIMDRVHDDSNVHHLSGGVPGSL